MVAAARVRGLDARVIDGREYLLEWARPVDVALLRLSSGCR
jgi:hypothetical protein